MAYRQKMLATGAAMGVTFPVIVLGYVLMLGMWPFDKIPVILLALPWLPALLAGWWVRRKLWPGGAFGR